MACSVAKDLLGRVGLKNQTERNINESIIHTIISWLHLDVAEKIFLPYSWHISFATFSELISWQLKVGVEKKKITQLSRLVFSFQVILNSTWHSHVVGLFL